MYVQSLPPSCPVFLALVIESVKTRFAEQLRKGYFVDLHGAGSRKRFIGFRDSGFRLGCFLV